eukprot:3747170-Ditylum_brightwellii.AAC.1
METTPKVQNLTGDEDKKKKRSQLAAAQAMAKKTIAEQTKGEKLVEMDTGGDDKDAKVNAHKSDKEKMIEQGETYIGTMT